MARWLVSPDENEDWYGKPHKELERAMIYSIIRGSSPEYIGKIREGVRQNNPTILATFDDCVQRASTGRLDDGYFNWQPNPTATGASWSATVRHPIPTPISTPSLPAPGAGTPEEAAAAIAAALGGIAAGGVHIGGQGHSDSNYRGGTICWCGKDHGRHNYLGGTTCWCGKYNDYIGTPR